MTVAASKLLRNHRAFSPVARMSTQLVGQQKAVAALPTRRTRPDQSAVAQSAP